MKKTPYLVLALLSVTLMFTGPAVFAARLSDAPAVNESAEEKPDHGADEDTRVTLDFRDVDIRVVAKFISDLTGKNFVFDKGVRDQVTVYSPTEVTPEEAYRLFETVLKINDYTTIPGPNFIRIVPSQKARTMDIETRQAVVRGDRSKDDRVVTQLIRLQHADANELRALLQPLVDKTGVMMGYDSGNILIVTDYASNIARLNDIIKAIDVADEGMRLAVIELKHASAKDLSAELDQILQPTAGRKAPNNQRDYKVVPDERTNSLIIMARTAEIDMIRDLCSQLDTESPRGSDRVHVIFLKNAVADDLATVLNDLAAGQGANAQQQTQQQSRRPQALLLQENVFITAEPTTNALIIRAERQDFLVLNDIIEKLDIQRAQVLVEAVIMELTLSKSNALGSELRWMEDFPETGDTSPVAFGGTNLPSSGSSGLINSLMTNPFAGASGLVLGAAQGTLEFGGTTYLNIGALVQALEQDSDVNILSTPHLLTLDNEEAKIVVGEERPFLESSLTTATGSNSAAITNTYEYKDLGLTLKLTPHITQGEYIKLAIYQELKSFVSESETGAISSTKRETETTVQVKNGETVVISGLIENETRESRAQVPCLGDIPVLGWLAKTRTQSGDKLNLLILIKPTIVRTAEELQVLTDRKKREAEEAMDEEKMTYPPQGLDLLKDVITD